MAGLGGLPYFIQYQGELQQQAAAKQKQQQDMLVFQQQQQDRQRQQAAQAAAGNALPQLVQPPPPMQQPAPQPPAPGQPSQPMQQAGGGVPLPQGPVPGHAMPPQGVPPFRPMPTTPPQSQAAPQGAIPVPPQPQQAAQGAGGPLTMQSAIKVLQDQGLSGADLMAGLQQLTPMLDAQAKAQANQLQQQFNNELKLQTLQERHDEAQQRSQDRSLDRDARLQAHQDSISMQRESLALRRQMAQQRVAENPDAKLDPETRHFMAEQYLAAPDPSVFTNLGRGKQGGENVVALRKDIMALAKERGMSGADIAALGIGVQGEKAFARAAGTRTAAIETAGAEFQQVSPLVRQASAALPRSQSLDINAVMESAQTRTGDPRWVKLGQTIETAKNVYARAISPTGTPTEGTRTRADSHFKSTMTPEQINAALDIMDQEIAAARRAPAEVKESQRERIAGGKPASQAEPTKTIGNKTYVQRNGTWYEQ
jgi:hypothetical protein